jgi:hypothetical protein
LNLTTKSRLRALVALAALGLLSGCGGDGRLGVSGTVTVDGKPLESGVISFQPAAGNQGHSAGTSIQAGHYEVEAGKGLLPGEYQVRIQAFRKTGRMVEDPQFGQVEETVPMDFKEGRSLTATVSASEKNKIDFELHTATGP